MHVQKKTNRRQTGVAWGQRKCNTPLRNDGDELQDECHGAALAESVLLDSDAVEDDQKRDFTLSSDFKCSQS